MPVKPGQLEDGLRGLAVPPENRGRRHCIDQGRMVTARPLLGDRLTVGQQTLTLLIVVRIHVPQPAR